MFGIGMPEMLMILVVALVVVGPKRLPEMAHTIGKAMAKLRAMGNAVQQEIDREMKPVRDLNPFDDDSRVQRPTAPAENTSIENRAEHSTDTPHDAADAAPGDDSSAQTPDTTDTQPKRD
jgi:Tat protein translocase TatB subunit